MYIRKWKQELFTVPNLLSFLRIGLIPIYMTIFLRADTPRDFAVAGGILILSCLTDALDGYIARKFNRITEFGKLLDPIADKLTQCTLTACLSVKYPVMVPVLALLILKEGCQLAACIVNCRRGKVLPGAQLPGKISTVVLFVSLILLVLFPDISQEAVAWIALIDVLFLFFTFVSYTRVYLHWYAENR